MGNWGSRMAERGEERGEVNSDLFLQTLRAPKARTSLVPPWPALLTNLSSSRRAGLSAKRSCFWGGQKKSRGQRSGRPATGRRGDQQRRGKGSWDSPHCSGPVQPFRARAPPLPPAPSMAQTPPPKGPTRRSGPLRPWRSGWASLPEPRSRHPYPRQPPRPPGPRLLTCVARSSSTLSCASCRVVSVRASRRRSFSLRNSAYSCGPRRGKGSGSPAETQQACGGGVGGCGTGEAGRAQGARVGQAEPLGRGRRGRHTKPTGGAQVTVGSRTFLKPPSGSSGSGSGSGLRSRCLRDEGSPSGVLGAGVGKPSWCAHGPTTAQTLPPCPIPGF